MDVSIIIVNYNTSTLVKDCVRSIVEKTKGIDYEVIIVDNDSEPKFQSIISEAITPDLIENFKFIRLPENIGFGRANNEGIKIANGRNIFFLNPDTLLLNNAIKILSDFLDSHPKAGACGGNLFDNDYKPTTSFKRFLPGFFWELNELTNNLPEKILYKPNREFNHTSQCLKVGFISGADLMVKKIALSDTKGFRKEYFLFFEETDLCFRLKKYGWEIYNIPSAHIQHLESKSFNPSESLQSEFKIKHIERSRIVFYNLNKKSFSRNLFLLMYKMSLDMRILLIKNQPKKNYYRQRKKYFLCNKFPYC